MKILLLLSLCLGMCLYGYAQTKAVTDKGEEVLLYSNGTWRFANALTQVSLTPIDIMPNTSTPVATKISTNYRVFLKSFGANFLLKSTKLNVGFWIDPKKWTFERGDAGASEEYKLQQKSGNLYGKIISEKIQIPLETLRDAALKNARAASPDIVVMREEYRIINGLKILHLYLVGSIQGVKYAYFSYNYSNTNGTVQYLVYSSNTLLTMHLADCEELLNGLVETQF